MERSSTPPIPASLERCPHCGAAVEWRLSQRGAWIAYPPGQTRPHFLACAGRPYRRPPPSTADHLCARCGGANTVRTKGAAMHFAGLRCKSCGAFRWLRHPRNVGGQP